MHTRGVRFVASRSARALVASSALGLLAVAGCQGQASDAEEAAGETHGSVGSSRAAAQEVTAPEVSLSYNVKRNGVAVDTPVTVTAQDGTLERVVVRRSNGKKLPGELNEDETTWTASRLLEPGTTYRIKTEAENADGKQKTEQRRFRTDDLTLDEQTYIEYMQPFDGATVGVGMPVVLQFDIPVKDKASFERNLHVTSKPKVEGTWHWYSDTEVHYRPKNYWPTGTKVSVHADINSVSAGDGVYGQYSAKTNFTVGSKVISKINVDRHQMKVFIDDKLARTIPVTGGMPGFETRSGTKVIMEKHVTKDMDAATTGISEDNPEYYNISDVPYALRVTWSGEFVHGAPWSVGSQGSANVSHGCVGMSVENAEWLFNQTTVGDVVKVTGTDRSLEPGNGWTDWDVPYKQYKKGSALS